MADVRLLKIGSTGGFAEVPDSDLGLLGGLNMAEAASAPGGDPGAGRAKLWVKNDAPNTLIFTDDTNVDHDLTAGGASVAGSDTQVQYNDADAFGASADLTFDPDVSGIPSLYLGASDGQAILKLGSASAPTGAALSQVLDMGVRSGSDAPFSNLGAMVMRLNSFGGGGNFSTSDSFVFINGLNGVGVYSNNEMKFHVGLSPTTSTSYTHRWQGGGAWDTYNTSQQGHIQGAPSTGTLVINQDLSGRRRIELDANFDLATPFNATTLFISGQRDGTDDRWLISTSGNSGSAVAFLRLQAAGQIELVPQGQANILNDTRGVHVYPNAALSQPDDNSLLRLTGRSSDNRLISVSSGAGTYGALEIDADVFVQGGSNNFYAFRMNIREDATPTNQIMLARWLYDDTVVFRVDSDGDVYPRDVAYTWPSAVGAAGAVLTDAAGDGALSWTVPTGGSGTVDTSGSPAATQVARFTDADTITGDAELTYVSDTSEDVLTLGGQASGAGTNVIRPGASGAMIMQGFVPSGGDADGGVAALYGGSPAGTGTPGDTQMLAATAGGSSGERGGQVILTPGGGDGAGFDGIVHVNSHGLKIGGSASANHPGTGGIIATGSAVVGADAAPGTDEVIRVAGSSLSHLLMANSNGSNENIALLAASAPNWNGMDRGLFIGNISAAPTGDPSGGGYLYVSSGALYWRGSSGNITEIARA